VPDRDPDAALSGRRVVLGVCGGIAAYKAVEVCRRLVDAGAWVSPVMTKGAERFVTAVTFSALASEPVRTSLWDSPETIPHTHLGQKADLVLVAPATARLLGSYAAGISSDLLTATLLATLAPVVVCPAMHTEMWDHPAVVDNIATLRRRGVHIVEPVTGRLAGGDIGSGRLAEPAEIVAAAADVLSGCGPERNASCVPERNARRPISTTPGTLHGVTAVVTAGGTREPIDPVRFIGNRSSGKQGYAVAAELARRGASVTLISTSSAALTPPAGVKVVAIETSAEMEMAVMAASSDADAVVMAAAVADFRPKAPAREKIKKSDGTLEVILEPTVDILAALGARRRRPQVLVGFAAETIGAAKDRSPLETLRRSAYEKLVTKKADLIVANDVAAPGVGFGHDTNAVLIVGADGSEIEVPLATKATVAIAVVDAIAARLPGPDTPNPAP
jgi:phosphopantothenoylcysteine decarboxylase/phosphopantothenate--cysteine ligase